MTLIKTLCLNLLTAALLSSCTTTLGIRNDASEQRLKNVILMIGDGMGPGQLGLLEEYARRAPNSIYGGKTTAISQFAAEGVVGLSRHGPYDSLVVDSACSATQLATGKASNSEMIGLDWQGNPIPTVLEKARDLGKATGLVSDTRLTHATPASFAAHQPHRSMENEIAVDMLSANVDVMLSGGLRHWIPEQVNHNNHAKQAIADLIKEPRIPLFSKRKDNRNLLLEARDEGGYQLAFNSTQMSHVKNGKLLGLFAKSGMADGISSQESTRAATQPSLRQMTLKALEILSQDTDGFFLMIEGGQIDWAAHSNDAGTMLHELLKFDAAIKAVYEWAKDRNDTLVVITADHETGGFGFSYGRHNLYPAQELPGSGFSGRHYKPNYNFGRLEILDRLFQQKKTFTAIWDEAASKGKAGTPTAASLQASIEANTGFDIGLTQAAEILLTEPNDYFTQDHPTLSVKSYPKVNDFKEFYVYGEQTRVNLIGRKLAKYQNIVWGTGTHTHIPVQVIAWGPDSIIKNYAKLLHHTEVGRLAMEAITGTLNF